MGACGLALAVLALPQLLSEVKPYFVSDLSPASRLVAITTGDYVYGKSLVSKDMYLRDCLDLIGSAFGKAQPTVVRRRLLEACGVEAGHISELMPAFGLAKLVVASASDPKKPTDFDAALTSAQVLAPNDFGQAEKRLRLGFSRGSDLSEIGQSALDRDIVALLGTDGGARSLAAIFVAFEGQRARITGLAEGAPADQQVRFVSRVREIAETRAK
jgi:hypothetical protein